MNSYIKPIKKMLEENAFDKEILIQILQSFEDDMALIPVCLLKDQKVLRTRPNEDDFFGHVKQLTYPPVEYARTDRASLVGKPMFYASIFTKNANVTYVYPRIVSALETITLLRSGGASGVKCMTQSVWNINEPIHLFAFPFSDKYKRACTEVGMLKADWEKLLLEHYSEASVDFFTFIGDLMAESSTSCLYDVTATCVDYILTNFNFEGVIYPSVPVEGEGLNICLKSNVVDQKVSFAGAATEVIFRNGDRSRIEVVAHAKMINNDSFEWIVTEEGKSLMIAAGLLDSRICSDMIVVRSKELMNS